MKKIAVLTSGGDAPGMNNAIYGIVQEAKKHKIEVYFVKNGFKGLVEDDMSTTLLENIHNYVSRGGTCLYTARYPEFKEAKTREKAVKLLKKKGIEAVIVIGGDGSFQGAQKLHELGIKTIGLPGTIDNDIASTAESIGYDTALNNIVDAINKIRDTSESHDRCIFVEVMGNHNGALALYSGLATAAEIIITNEYTLNADEIAEIVRGEFKKPNKHSVVIVVSEKIYPDLNKLAKEVGQKSGCNARSMVLGYIQRGGSPTARDRINAALLGIQSVNLLVQGKSGIVLGYSAREIVETPILEALKLEGSTIEERTEIAKHFNKLSRA
ncbi:6-phosphofructokinase [Mycoplasmopsis californica]|uniref:ATP-dependent 6-phosphofructokinase n=1 Tax=Mycoplasmopsis equigenitalium TaxID=114883 RepID=A0ABY5J166_9BACT|nr:6-phosphofructokinase [Mycoplasmopsis equigenitalium]UUD36964.1 6-phosphofructokinase [Mycoplasmopsis equigenitalium]VEU69741.1 6-phosphofructokinase [Mycoplasmopsis californica]